jgi:toxin ParE1/3/4
VGRQAGREVQAHRDPAVDGPRQERSRANVRSFPFGRYVIFYEPIEDGIDVVRVLHSARDIDAVFGEDQ